MNAVICHISGNVSLLPGAVCIKQIKELRIINRYQILKKMIVQMNTLI